MSINYVALSLAFSIIEGLAVILTIFRLGFRLKIQRFWWEDAWAAVASLFASVSIISSLIFSTTSNHESALIASWVNAYMFTCIVWSVRMSLVVSLLRIAWSTVMHRITLTVAAFFFLCWATALGLQTWWCLDRTRTWSAEPRPDCMLSHPIVIFEVTTNCLADGTTLLLSLKLLWGVRLPRRQRRMIISLFTASRFLCAFALAHSVSQLVGEEAVEEILAALQLVGFLIICNLLVVVTYIYRVFSSPSGGDLAGDDDFTTPRSRSTENFTTVDLNYECTMSEFGSSYFPSPSPSTV